MVPLDRALHYSCRLSIITIPLFLAVWSQLPVQILTKGSDLRILPFRRETGVAAYSAQLLFVTRVSLPNGSSSVQRLGRVDERNIQTDGRTEGPRYGKTCRYCFAVAAYVPRHHSLTWIHGSKLTNTFTYTCCESAQWLASLPEDSNKKIIKFCLRLSTTRGSCLYNISWIQANWLKQYHAHKNTHKNTCDLWPITLIFNRLLEVVKIHS